MFSYLKRSKILLSSSNLPSNLIVKVHEIDKTCIIPWGCISREKHDFEILMCSSDYNWATAEKGNVPVNAFIAGHSEQGESLYIGRVIHQGKLFVGKIQPSHGVCYFAFEDKELNVPQYEVFVV